MKRFHHDFWLQVYMYVYINVDTEIIPEWDYFPGKIFSKDNTKG